MWSRFKLSVILSFSLINTISMPILAQDLINPANNENHQHIPVTTASLPSLQNIPGSMEHMVNDPISNGETYIYEVGMSHPVSVMLIHGVGDEGSRTWGHLIPELAMQYHVVTFDLPGFGRSSKQNILYSPEFYAKFINWVKKRYIRTRPFIMIGHSLGGAVALYHAAIYPDNLKRLILVDVSGVIHRLALTQHIMENISEKKNGLLKYPSELFGILMSNTMEAIESSATSGKIDMILATPQLRSRFLSADPHKIAGLALVNFDFSDLIYRVKAPTVIIWGSHDPITPIRTGKLLAYMMEKTQLNVIPETGHNPILERPVAFNRKIQDALVTESWQSTWKPPKKSDRVAVLKSKHNLTLTGYYKYVELSHCGNIRLEDLVAEYINVFNCDDIIMENIRINGKTYAINTRGSRIKLTGSQLTGDTAIIVSGSELDLAGVKLKGHKAAVRAINGSILLFSVSKIESPYNKGYIHGSYEVVRGSPL